MNHHTDASKSATTWAKTTSSMEAAVYYAQLGIPVFPVHSINSGQCTCGKSECKSPGKHPMTANGFKNATCNLEVIRQIWDFLPNANIGILTGKISGFFALDIDPKSGGPNSLRDIERQYGSLPETVKAVTGSGGNHLLFKYVAGIKNTTGFRPGLDIRGDGGYIVVAPSNHKSGGVYTWVDGHAPGEIPLADSPSWLMNLFQKRDSNKNNIDGRAADSVDEIPEGRRNSTLTSIGGSLRRKGAEFEEIFERLSYESLTRCKPPLSETELEQIARSVCRYEPEDQEHSGDKPNSFADYAEKFLIEKNLVSGDLPLLRFWHGDHYKYNGKHYEPVSEEELKCDIINFLQKSDAKGRKKATSSSVSNILFNLNGMTLIRNAHSVPCRISSGYQKQPNVFVLGNGIIHVERLIAGEANAFEPHTPDLFALGSVNYKYDPVAQCPIWERFLQETLPDQEVRELVQEWFGYNLIADTRHHKFMLFEGEGANGKTVVCIVLRVLLGDCNVSSVGLEAFSPSRTFALAATDGKLANIVGEMNEVDRTAEGLLKSFVAGEPISVERKFRDPYDLLPTARLTFATNVLPTFSDRSDGLWRRMLLVPFANQILDVTKQDRRLVEPDFWVRSGEVPGIFNWALAGLKRLQQRGYFHEPMACLAAKADYKLDMNPARTFLLDECEACSTEEISTRELYERYTAYAKQAGHMPLGRGKFTKEVKRAFRSAKASDDAIRMRDGTRSRVWKGIKIKA